MDTDRAGGKKTGGDEDGKKRSSCIKLLPSFQEKLKRKNGGRFEVGKKKIVKKAKKNESKEARKEEKGDVEPAAEGGERGGGGGKPHGKFETISLTFGDRAENHVGMQCIGTLADKGFTCDELAAVQKKFEKEGLKTQMVLLHEFLPSPHLQSAPSHKACVLIVRGGLNHVLSHPKAADDLWREQRALDHDKKAKMYGRVVNKHARWNLCFAGTSQEPDYEKGKGRVVAFQDCQNLTKLRRALDSNFGVKAKSLLCELNFYYDVRKCGIGFHGDSERKIVVCARLGASMPMDFQWFTHSRPVGRRCHFVLHHGDMYAMSEKATGCDWKKDKKGFTLRHAAGCEKFRTPKKK
eukprot:g3447.t1